jgi:hypothetical protein
MYEQVEAHINNIGLLLARNPHSGERAGQLPLNVVYFLQLD